MADVDAKIEKYKKEATESGDVEPILKYFEYKHLPERLRDISEPFHDMAWALTIELPRSAERAAGLRKLLEAKDCFVRAALP